MQYPQKSHWFPLIGAIVFGVGVIALGSYHTWPNLEALNESRARWIGIWEYWEQSLISLDGRYMTNFLHCINPVALGWLPGYKIMPLIAVGLFVGSLWFFLSAIVRPSLQSFLLVFLFGIVHFAISPSITDELFHMIATFVYLYSVCFWLLWTGAAIRCYSTAEGTKSNLWFFMAAVFLVACTGTCEMFLVINSITLAAILLLAYRTNSVSRVMPLIAVGILSFLFCFGNFGSLRRIQVESQANNPVFYQRIGLYFSHYLQACAQMFSQSFFLFPVFLMLAFTLTLKAEAKHFIANTGNRYILVLMFLGIITCMTLPFYLFMAESSSQSISGRVFSPVVFYIQALLIFGVWIKASAKPSISVAISKYRLYICIAILFALVLGKNNYTAMISEYRSGIYTKFNDARYLRYQMLSKARENDEEYKFAEVPDRQAYNMLIYVGGPLGFAECINDPNRVYEFYYGLDEVKFKSDSFTKRQILADKICSSK
jgi:hypothetical protein